MNPVGAAVLFAGFDADAAAAAALAFAGACAAAGAGGKELRPSGLIDVFFATSKTWQKNARIWPTYTPFGSAPREESIAGVFAVLQGKRFFGPPAGALCLDYFSFKSLLRRHWIISNLYPYSLRHPRPQNQSNSPTKQHADACDR